VKRVAYCTFGCRLNQYDTETLRTLLEVVGEWRTVPFDEEADVYVVNTCSVTAKADARARNMIRRIHGERPGARIVATGCYAQRVPEELAALPGVSLVLGAADRERVAEEVARLEPGRVRMAVSPIAEAVRFHEVPITEMMDKSRAFVKVQEGCNESCTFCIIPQTRGRSRSRRPERVLDQVHALAESGYAEIVLTGVHVGDYGLDLAEERRLLPDLARRILQVPGLARLRVSSIEPSTVTDELIALMAGEEKFARHFHIPFQSGSDEILRGMNRRYAAGEYAELIHRIARRVPGCGIGTDVICGFPGETDDHFRETFDHLVALPIAYIHPFTYSVRPGSRAESMGDHVPGDVKKRRTRALKKLSGDKSRAFRERLVGRKVTVFAEQMRVAGEPHVGGLTDNYVRVDLGPGRAAETLLRARVTGVTDDGVVGERIAA
jgi:threonylcarbamoyladenosine tRNA methylthiotransferase MtaB